jgi:DUF2075 family protein
MLVYSGNKKKFLDDVQSNNIENIILGEFQRKLFKRPSNNEVLSWKNSMQYMFNVMIDPDIPQDSGVSIEYVLPLTSKRVDFILTGKNENQQETAVIIELKQWSEVKKTEKDGVVITRFSGGEAETNHPSYQAWTYAALIEDYNETVRKEAIGLIPCAYLHNLKSDTAINDPYYKDHTEKAPVFISHDARKLAEFLKKHVKYGDSRDIMYRIEHGKIKPSKSLADSLSSMMVGNQEFLMIDEQKLVYEEAIDLAHKAYKNHKKQVLIVEGGPGTGKSVVAINLLAELTKREMNVQYVSKNAAPRDVFAAKLTGTLKKTKINNMFKGSGSYIDTEPNFWDALIVDEAHRLNKKSGMLQNLGEHQVKEIISASKLSIFFIDEDQRVTLKDVGSLQEIEKWASLLGAEIHRMELKSQFRCNGSDAYLAWLDSILQIRETANTTLENIDYDFRVFDSPVEMRQEILKRNSENKARLVAGYCWKWQSKKNKNNMDIIIPEFQFEAQWNLATDGSLWIISPESVREIGCIHTCQGLEVDYIGVIIGPDLIVRDGVVITDPSQRDSGDNTIKGYKKLLKDNPDQAKETIGRIIKNTYRTLMTRGQKGCYLFCTDKETREYFANMIAQSRQPGEMTLEQRYPGLNLRILSSDDIDPSANAVPIYDLKVAAGNFSDYQAIENFDLVELPEHIRVTEGCFVAQVVGESMNRRIPSGSWCLFKTNPGGSREGKIVLVQHRDIQDQDTGGQFTIKEYHSEKVTSDEDSWAHYRIVLKPKTNALGYKDIVLENDQTQELKVIGEFLTVLS